MPARISSLRLREKAEGQAAVQVESTDGERGRGEFQSAQRKTQSNRKDIKQK